VSAVNTIDRPSVQFNQFVPSIAILQTTSSADKRQFEPVQTVVVTVNDMRPDAGELRTGRLVKPNKRSNFSGLRLVKFSQLALPGLLAIPFAVFLIAKAPMAAKPDEAQATAEGVANLAVAIFAGGCFWCVESDFDHVPGVLATVSGYTGGNTDNPTYKTHSKDRHREAVEITYDPSVTSYEKLLNVFWRSVNPTDDGGQFCDRGHSYTTAIYTLDQSQFDMATASKLALEKNSNLDKPIVTPIEAASEFYPAEGYHQDYYQKNPIRYQLYRKACGRDDSVKRVWGAQAYAGISDH